MARIFISLGSNIDAEHHIRAGVVALRREFGDLTLSSVFESEAVGFKGSNFLNMVAGADTRLSVVQVVTIFKRIEREHGRLPGARKFSPRTLDLDLLLYDGLVCEAPVTLPRAEITANAFVLWPLAELLPEGIHPLAHTSYRELWAGFDKTSQRLWPIEFTWSC